VRVGASPETEARRAAITLATLAVKPLGREQAGILAGVSDLNEIRDAARIFIAERDWQQFQDPKSILLALVGEVGELAELLQWLPADEARDRLRQEPLHTRAAEEMADVLVYLVGLADQCGIDLGSAALAKVAASADKYPTDENRGVAPDKT
jgi:dCTP diphosphatase